MRTGRYIREPDGDPTTAWPSEASDANTARVSEAGPTLADLQEELGPLVTGSVNPHGRVTAAEWGALRVLEGTQEV